MGYLSLFATQGTMVTIPSPPTCYLNPIINWSDVVACETSNNTNKKMTVDKDDNNEDSGDV